MEAQHIPAGMYAVRPDGSAIFMPDDPRYSSAAGAHDDLSKLVRCLSDIRERLDRADDGGQP
jgi:hypothetical protein